MNRTMHLVSIIPFLAAAMAGCATAADENTNSTADNLVEIGSGHAPDVSCNPHGFHHCSQTDLSCLPTNTDSSVGACCDVGMGECAVLSQGRPMCLGNGAIQGELRCTDGVLKKVEGALCGGGGPGCFDGRCTRVTGVFAGASSSGSSGSTNDNLGVCCPAGWCASINGGAGSCSNAGASAPGNPAIRCFNGAWR